MPCHSGCLAFLRLTRNRNQLLEGTFFIWHHSINSNVEAGCGRLVALHPFSWIAIPVHGNFAGLLILAERGIWGWQWGARESWVLNRERWWVRRWGPSVSIPQLAQEMRSDAWEATGTIWREACDCSWHLQCCMKAQVTRYCTEFRRRTFSVSVQNTVTAITGLWKVFRGRGAGMPSGIHFYRTEQQWWRGGGYLTTPVGSNLNDEARK